MIASLIRHGMWRGRSLLRLRPRDLSEALWRLRGLRHLGPGQAGTCTWLDRPYAFADGAAALLQFREIFGGGVYDFKTTEVAPRIIDCGAHTGCAVLRWRKLYPAARITAIEADAGIAALLRKNLATWEDGQTEVIPAAAWTSDGEVRFAPTGRDNGVVGETGTRVIPALDLARLCTGSVDLLKLDVEGAEGTILEHLAGRGALRRVRALVCEWHEWDLGPPTLHKALSRLAETGFVYRLTQADTLGDEPSPVFPHLRQPGNQLMVYAWQQ